MRREGRDQQETLQLQTQRRNHKTGRREETRVGKIHTPGQVPPQKEDTQLQRLSPRREGFPAPRGVGAPAGRLLHWEDQSLQRFHFGVSGPYFQEPEAVGNRFHS